MRIVSLIASSTEILCALGRQSELVGRSHECDYPASVRTLPQVTEPKFFPEGTSYEIDQRVKAILQEGLSVYRVHAEALAALEPDLIVTQTQCEVCAVSENDVEAAVCGFVGTRPHIVSLHPNQLADVWADIRRVAAALGDVLAGEALVARLEARLAPLSPCGARPRVAVVEWIDPLMAAGNWMPELVERAGGVNLFGDVGKHSPWMSLDELARRDPDLIFLTPCGFDLAKTEEEMRHLDAQAGWRGLRAVREGRVFLGDGNQYFNRPGPRLAESLEILAEVFHPSEFRFGHEGSGWRRYGA